MEGTTEAASISLSGPHSIMDARHLMGGFRFPVFDRLE